MARDRAKVPEKVKAGEFPRILILVGPTAVGKTDVSLHLARRLGGEIISADSRLVYRLMDIGTAKPHQRLRSEIPHHMIDVADPGEEYTCKEFERAARRAVRAILARRRVAIVVGGAGLYVKAVTDGIFEGPGRDMGLRRKLKDEAQTRGKSHVWRKLHAVDPRKARQIDPENLVRVIRALEVYHLTGVPMSELEKHTQRLGMPYAKFGLIRDRQELYSLIDKRVDRMMELGFLEEVRHLVDEGYGSSPAVSGSLGYGEMLRHLEGSLKLREAVELVRRNTRHLAKRQMTWFRKDKEITWIDITGRCDYDHIACRIIDIFT